MGAMKHNNIFFQIQHSYLENTPKIRRYVKQPKNCMPINQFGKARNKTGTGHVMNEKNMYSSLKCPE